MNHRNVSTNSVLFFVFMIIASICAVSTIGRTEEKPLSKGLGLKDYASFQPHEREMLTELSRIAVRDHNSSHKEGMDDDRWLMNSIARNSNGRFHLVLLQVVFLDNNPEVDYGILQIVSDKEASVELDELGRVTADFDASSVFVARMPHESKLPRAVIYATGTLAEDNGIVRVCEGMAAFVFEKGEWRRTEVSAEFVE